MMISRQDLQIILKSKKYIVFSAVLFFIFFSLGVLFSAIYPELAKNSLESLVDSFSFLFDFSPIEMGIFLFLNNSIKILIFMLLGVFYALPTLFFLVINGWVLGYVIGVSFSEIGIKGIFYSVFLHGVFELSALFIGTALGISIGILFYQQTREKRFKIFPLPSKIKYFLISSLKIYLYLILPLLFIASLIETYLIYY
jgi:stage II sporulation protein M